MRPPPGRKSLAQIVGLRDGSQTLLRTVRNEVGGFLKQNGLSVSFGVDGHVGLSQPEADSSVKVIICDVNMPNMDGLTMVEKVRSELRQPRSQRHHACPAMKDAARLPASKVGSSNRSTVRPS